LAHAYRSQARFGGLARPDFAEAPSRTSKQIKRTALFAVSPELAPGPPQRAEPVLMGDGVLDDERVESLGMGDCEPPP